MPYISKKTVVHLFQPHHLVAKLPSLTIGGIIGVTTKIGVYDLFREITAARSANKGSRAASSPLDNLATRRLRNQIQFPVGDQQFTMIVEGDASGLGSVVAVETGFNQAIEVPDGLSIKRERD
jgi:hypothetical protein